MSQMRWVRKHELMTVKSVCPWCRKEFGPRQCGKQWYITTYCSKSCAKRHMAPKIPEQSCEYCGKTFRRPPGVGTSRGGRRFCSKPCADRAMCNPEGWIRKRGKYPVFWTGKAEVLVHRIEMERKLGRPLRDTETVHHINGDREDWRPENLELWDHAQPHGQRVPDKLAWCAEYMRLHGYVVTPPGSK